MPNPLLPIVARCAAAFVTNNPFPTAVDDPRNTVLVPPPASPQNKAVGLPVPGWTSESELPPKFTVKIWLLPEATVTSMTSVTTSLVNDTVWVAAELNVVVSLTPGRPTGLQLLVSCHRPLVVLVQVNSVAWALPANNPSDMAPAARAFRGLWTFRAITRSCRGVVIDFSLSRYFNQFQNKQLTT